MIELERAEVALMMPYDHVRVDLLERGNNFHFRSVNENLRCSNDQESLAKQPTRSLCSRRRRTCVPRTWHGTRTHVRARVRAPLTCTGATRTVDNIFNYRHLAPRRGPSQRLDQ